MNTVVLIGVVKTMSGIKETSNGNKIMNVTLEVQRPFKNMEGFYDSDFIDIVLWKGIAQTCQTLGSIGGHMSVKGRIQTRKFENPETGFVKTHEVIADRIYFLSKPKT